MKDLNVKVKIELEVSMGLISQLHEDMTKRNFNSLEDYIFAKLIESHDGSAPTVEYQGEVNVHSSESIFNCFAREVSRLKLLATLNLNQAYFTDEIYSAVQICEGSKLPTYDSLDRGIKTQVGCLIRSMSENSMYLKLSTLRQGTRIKYEIV